jgi:hypothetical protein
MIWHMENTPDNYKGAYILRIGMDGARFYASGDGTQVLNVVSAAEAPVAADSRDAFALRFYSDPAENRFHVNYASGLTWEGPPPSEEQAGENLLVWDFRQCERGALGQWEVAQAQPLCERDRGLVVRPSNEDAHIVGPQISLDPQAIGARFVRLRVSVRYPAGRAGVGMLNQWFWHGASEDWSESRSLTMPVKASGLSHVYWTFLPASDVGNAITRLRFDPANGTLSSAIQWIAVDLVK